MLKKLNCVALAIILAFALLGCNVKITDGLDGYKNYETEVFATGIQFNASLLGGDEDAAFAEMKVFMQDINNDMSLSLSSSALTTFNKSTEAGFSVEVQKFTYDVIVKSKLIYDITDGAFNIAVNDLSELWSVDTAGLNKYGGITNDIPAPPPPDYAQVLQKKENCDLSNLQCYTLDGKYYIKKLTADLKIDLGAIAKGYSADECVAIALKHGITSGFINISGNISLIGKWYNQSSKKYSGWNIGVVNPRERGGISGNVCAVKIPDACSIVTSGDYQRFYDYVPPQAVGAPLYVCHIIDSKSGMPINIDYNELTKTYSNKADGVTSAVVLTQNSAEADAYATAICVLGYEKGVQLMQKLGLQGIIFTEDKRMALVGIAKDEAKGGVTLLQDTYPPIDAYKQYTITEYLSKI